MRSNLLAVGVVATMWACSGTTFGPIPDGGSDSGGGSSSGGSGGSGGSSGGSSGGGSSSGSSGSGSSSGGSSGTGSTSGGSSGGGSSSGGSSGGGSSSGGSSGATDAGRGACPASPPAANGACPSLGFQCEYGSDPNPGCNEIAVCQASGWSVTASGPGACPGGTCPASYAAVAQEQSCSPNGLDCAYPEGQCNCARLLLIATPGPVWQCSVSTPGCPEPRPRLGDACSQPGVTCDYGACSGGIAMQCVNGAWQRQATACEG